VKAIQQSQKAFWEHILKMSSELGASVETKKVTGIKESIRILNI